MDQSDEFKIMSKFRGYYEHWFQVPPVLRHAVKTILKGRHAEIVCDPWAGHGVLLSIVQESTGAKTAYALTNNDRDAAVGKEFAKNAQWQVGNPLDSLNNLPDGIDVFASILPFGMKWNPSLDTTHALPDEMIDTKYDFSDLILAVSAKKLKHDGAGIFVVAPAFFNFSKSVLHQFYHLGIGIEAAFALPPGSFAPTTNILTYLVIIRNFPLQQMFVAELSSDINTNTLIINNYKEGKKGSSLELGRYVIPHEFQGISVLRVRERLQKTERQYQTPSFRLGEISTAITLGRFRDDFEFPKVENAIYIPLIGNSEVVDSLDAMTTKRQNYAQVVIDPEKSYARFVVYFLNSEFGREIREAYKSGSTVQRLNSRTIIQLTIYIPDLQTQKAMIEVEALIITQQNVLSGLQNEFNEYRRKLWTNPTAVEEVRANVQTLSNRLSGNLRQQVVESLDQWVETLPFPLASILRAWKAEPNDAYKVRYEHLLKFFEANAEFLSTILLSAFSTQELLFQKQTETLQKALANGRVSLSHATFGTWKVLIEYLSKQTRDLLGKDADARASCVSMFTDLILAETLSQKALVGIVNSTNKMRNDWYGHTGAINLIDAKYREEKLVEELQKLREAMGVLWLEIRLLRPLNSRLRHGTYENQVHVLMSSNSGFLIETCSMPVCMDTDYLYLARKNSDKALQLLPLIQLGHSPESVQNACYFYNRVEQNGCRFISYYFEGHPEITSKFDVSGPLKPLLGI